MTDEKTDLQKWADGLREVAAFAEQHPDLFAVTAWCGKMFNIFAYDALDMAEKTRQLGASEKVVSGTWFTMRRTFGPHKVEVNIARDTYCEKVQTGTRIVRHHDPKELEKLALIEVEEPVYDWVCPDSVLNPASPDEMDAASIGDQEYHRQVDLELEEAAQTGDANTPWRDDPIPETVHLDEGMPDA